MSAAAQIQALAQGNYDELVDDAIASGSTPDQFLADLLTFESREPVLIAEGHALTAGEILFRTRSTTVTPGGSNDGNGALTVDSVGPSVLDGTYVATCTSIRSNAGIFQLAAPDGSIIAPINVGTPFVSDDLNFTIADGSTDFALGDSFLIAVTISGDYSPYAFETLTSNSVKVASAVLALDVDTTGGALEQFATAVGPAILPTNFTHIPAKPDDVDQDTYNALLAQSADQLAKRGIVSRGVMSAAAQITALAQGDFEQRVADAIAAGVSADQFFVDLATFKARSVVTIAAAQTLTSGEILCRALSTSVTVGGSNSGNGTLAVNAIGLMVVEGAYRAVCTSTSSNAGIFELRRPDGSAVAFASVGVPLVSGDLAIMITDGSSDFVVGDTFTITVTGGSYSAYDLAYALAGSPQFAAAVLAFDTTTTGSTAQQFATAEGPAILDGAAVHIFRYPGASLSGEYYNNAVLACVAQLEQRGIILRGSPQLAD